MPIAIFATVHPRPEHRDTIEAALRLMVENSRAEPGNLRYDLFAHEGDSPAFELFELYADEAAVEAHRASSHYQAYRAATVDWLAAPTRVQLARVLDISPFN